MPKFSIIIPTYNQGHLIGRCIESILNQTFQDFEVIVVNNYSSDDTLEVVNAYNDCRIKTFNIHNNGIISVSRNKGIKESVGEWICFLDSDDWWTYNKLMECDSLTYKFDLIYHNLRAVTVKGKRPFKLGRAPKKDTLAQILLNGNMICNSSVAIKKSVLLGIGGLSEDPLLAGVEDCDCWIRMAANKICFGYIPKILGYYWMNENYSVSLKQIGKEETLLNRYIDDLNDKQKKVSLKALAYRKARIHHKLGNFCECRELYWKSFNVRSFYEIARFILLYSAAFLHYKI